MNGEIKNLIIIKKKKVGWGWGGWDGMAWYYY